MRTWIGATVLTCCSIGLLGQTSSTSTLHVKKFVAPSYPAIARKAHFQGAATSELQIRADGTVESVKVTIGYPLFRSYVERALKQWVFEPTGTPTTLQVTVRFGLEQDCDHVPEGSVTETRVQADLPDSVTVNTCSDYITTNSN